MQDKSYTFNAKTYRRPDAVGRENPMIRDDDPYFGAEPLSEGTIIDEFGHVPSGASRNRKYTFKEESETVSDGCLVFHDNEFNEIQRLCQEPDAADIDEALRRRPLRDMTNVSRGDNSPSKSGQLLTIDDELDQEFEKIINHQIQATDPQKAASSRVLEDKDCWRRSGRDLYTPKWVRGTGMDREGHCDICDIWLKIKQSAYWYHMNFIHGISASTGRPHPPPVDMRQGLCEKHSGEQLMQVEGKCRVCHQWVVIAHFLPTESCEIDKYNHNSVWWRHAQKCGVAKTASNRGAKQRPTTRSK